MADPVAILSGITTAAKGLKSGLELLEGIIQAIEARDTDKARDFALRARAELGGAVELLAGQIDKLEKDAHQFVDDTYPKQPTSDAATASALDKQPATGLLGDDGKDAS